MSAQATQQVVNALLRGRGDARGIAGQEIARAVLAIRDWSMKAITLQGASDAQTIANIEAWLNEFRETFSINALNVNATSGYAGFAFARLDADMDLSREIYLELYRDTINTLTNKDLTKAYMLERGMAAKWSKTWRSFYDQFDEFMNEGAALGLTGKETVEKFLVSSIYENQIALIPNTRENFLRVQAGKAPRQWTPEAYSRMYYRTRSSEISDNILVDEMREIGSDTVRVSMHNTTTPICMKYEGKYFSLGGASGLPKLQVRPPFHPNCLHFLIPRARVPQDRMIRENVKRDRKYKAESKDFSASEKKYIKKQEDYNLIERQGKKPL